MISDFEQRLANVLGGRLPSPFTGQVEVAPGSTSGSAPRVFLGVQRIEPAEADIGSQSPEIVPGSGDHRRVLRLKCSVSIEIHPGASQGRAQQMEGLDAALYALDASDLRNGTALIEEGDPGFLIQEMQIVDALSPLDPEAPEASPVGLTLDAEGWFWPAGEPGETGVQIGEVRVRGAILPLEVLPAKPNLVAGGAPVELTLRLRSIGLRSNGQDSLLPPLPFGTLALALFDPGGGDGAGSLSGGTAGAEGVHLAELTDGIATVTYTPPAEAAKDELVIALDDGAEGLGVEIGRFSLGVRGA